MRPALRDDNNGVIDARKPEKADLYDVLVVGGGPTGLSAALILGRCCWRVLVIDAGEPRNRTSPLLHGFFTRDKTPPSRLLDIAREELRDYPNIEQRSGEVIVISKLSDRFQVSVAGEAQPVECRRLLLATGLIDELPPVAGAQELYGRGVYPCPICNGWELRGESIAVYAPDQDGAELAMEMLAWTPDVTLCTNGSEDVPCAVLERLREHGGIRIIEEKLTRLTGDGEKLECIYFDGRDPLPCRALFFYPRQRQQNSLAESLGCKFSDDGTVRKQGPCESSNICGLYVAGNASACGGPQLVIVAAAQGADAAHAIHCSLATEAFERGRKNATRGAVEAA